MRDDFITRNSGWSEDREPKPGLTSLKREIDHRSAGEAENMCPTRVALEFQYEAAQCASVHPSGIEYEMGFAFGDGPVTRLSPNTILHETPGGSTLLWQARFCA